MKLKKSLIVSCLIGLLLGVNFGAFSQSRITLDVKSVSLEGFFSELRKQTGVEFVHSEIQAKELQPITMVVKSETLDNVLKKLLSNSKLGYTLKGNVVLIVPAVTAKKSEDNNPVSTTQRSGSQYITGTIVNSKGEPLTGVTVKAMGSKTATTSRSQGTFSFWVPKETKQIQITSVGFQTQTINIDGQKTLKVTLKKGTNELEDVIVVAYGTTTKREQTGAISVVTAKEIEGVPASSVSNLLQGRVAGMDVTNMSGAPGSGGTSIVIRGYNSLDIEQERRFSGPLWVVDGVPMNTFTSPITGTNLLSDLNPDMIESIQVLKDASSAAIYGSRAANGVILVTTKKGKSGQKAVFSFNASQTLSILPHLPTITTGRAEREHRVKALRKHYTTYLDHPNQVIKYPETLKEIYTNQGQGGTLDFFWNTYGNQAPSDNGNVISLYQDSLNSYYNNSTNFFPLFYQTALVNNANFQSYGGSESVNYGVGFGYYNEEGVVIGTGFSRIDFNTSLQARPVKKALIDARLYLSTGTRNRGTNSQNGLRSAPLIEVIPGDPMELSSLLPGGDSPVWDEVLNKIRGTKEKNRSLRLRPSLLLNYEIAKGLKISTSGALDYSLERRNYFTPSYLDPLEKGRNKSLGEQGINLMVLNENLITYKKNIGSHNISLLVGQSYQYDQSEYNGGEANGGPSDLIWYAPPSYPSHTYDEYNGSSRLEILKNYQSDMWEKSLLSWFGRAEYNYKQRYLLSIAYRKDGSSVFGDNNKWGAFPSIGLGYNFADDIKWEPMNFGKLRFSWGRSGLQFYSPYLALGILNSGNTFESQAGLLPDWREGMYNQSLSWEQTDQYDFGLDIDFFDSRLSFVADYYYRYTDRLLDKVPLPGSYNSYDRQWRNAAAISNEGIELLLRYEVFRRNDLYWKLTLNGAKNWNLFAKSYGNYAEAIYNVGSIARVLGKPLNGILAIQTDGFVNDQDEIAYYYSNQGIGSYFGVNNHYRPGDWKVNDLDGDGTVSPGDYIHAGSALPVVSGGMGSEFRWKGLEVNWLFSFQVGRHIINQQPFNTTFTGIMAPKLVHPLLIDLSKVTFWEEPGDNHAQFPYYRANMNSIIVDRYVQNVSWLKLKTVVLGYNWNNTTLQKAGINELRFFASGENLFTWSNYDGYDPETVSISSGIDDGMNYPLARKLTFGLTFKF